MERIAKPTHGSLHLVQCVAMHVSVVWIHRIQGVRRWILQFGLHGPKTGPVHKSCRAHPLDVGCGMEVAMEFFILFFCPDIFLLSAYFTCTQLI